MTSTSELEKMNIHQLEKEYERISDMEQFGEISSNEADEKLEIIHDLYMDAWKKEFPNLPFYGSPGNEEHLDHVLGTFETVAIETHAYTQTIFQLTPNAVECHFPGSSYYLKFKDKTTLDVKGLLKILNEMLLPDFGNHTFFDGFCVRGNIISIECGS